MTPSDFTTPLVLGFAAHDLWARGPHVVPVSIAITLFFWRVVPGIVVAWRYFVQIHRLRRANPLLSWDAARLNVFVSWGIAEMARRAHDKDFDSCLLVAAVVRYVSNTNIDPASLGKKIERLARENRSLLSSTR